MGFWTEGALALLGLCLLLLTVALVRLNMRCSRFDQRLADQATVHRSLAEQTDSRIKGILHIVTSESGMGTGNLAQELREAMQNQLDSFFERLTRAEEQWGRVERRLRDVERE